MSENSASRIPILIASSLKPTHDSRVWEKLGISLRETNKYELNIIGFSTKKEEKIESVKFYSSFARPGSKLSRILSLVRFTKILFRVRPKILICCTYEYLRIASFFKNRIGYKLVYDVQENYAANLNLNPTLSSSQKSKAAKLIRKMEDVKGIDLYFLAERCYQNEMPEKSPFLILENKFKGEILEKSDLVLSKKDKFSFLISGTITPAFGIFDGIVWFKEILKKYPKSSLHIIGHVPLRSFEIELEKLTENSPQISIQTSQIPIDHQEIMQAFSSVDFCLLPYQNHPEIWDKMPTKLFEAAALGVPVLISPNTKWEEFLKDFSGGCSIDFSKPKLAISQFDQAIQQTFFTANPSPSILWNSQEADFLSAIENLLS
ncbi:glycosyltransferase [Algoriphagus marinus]|uniref:glycosyltransferase n=1 Tax=Algoriphagus marinus TaxID=1925762 RepID=UPI00094B8485|nr:glycosyltransferase [Algoriphagus marinus]